VSNYYRYPGGGEKGVTAELTWGKIMKREIIEWDVKETGTREKAIGPLT
jgi:hypothetical protein